MNPDELKARLMAEAEAAIDKILANKPAGEDIALSEIEQLALSDGKDFREAVLGHLVEEGQTRVDICHQGQRCGLERVRRLMAPTRPCSEVSSPL